MRKWLLRELMQFILRFFVLIYAAQSIETACSDNLFSRFFKCLFVVFNNKLCVSLITHMMFKIRCCQPTEIKVVIIVEKKFSKSKFLLNL